MKSYPNGKIPQFDLAVEPTEWPVVRLKQELVALVRCINTFPPPTFGETCYTRPVSLEVGKYYLVCSASKGKKACSFLIPASNGMVFFRNGTQFDVIDDPLDIIGKASFLFQPELYEWRYRRTEITDHSTDKATADFLALHNLALVKYGNCGFPGLGDDQYLAEPHPTDHRYIRIVDQNRPEDIHYYPNSGYVLLNDPNRVLYNPIGALLDRYKQYS